MRMRSVSCVIPSSLGLDFVLCFVFLVGETLALFMLALHRISSCQGGYDRQVNIFLFWTYGFIFKLK